MSVTIISGDKSKKKPQTNKQAKIGFKTEKVNEKWGGTTHSVPSITKPKDAFDKNKIAFVFFDQQTLNSLTDECIEDAGSDEFQVGYRALLIRMKKGSFEAAMYFPTSFYNFEQEIGPSSVDFELQDLEREAEAVKAQSKENTQHILKALPVFEILKGHGYEISFEEGNFGSIHRHPGRFGFSSIDTRKDPKDPGVIYRQVEAEDFWQVDSVMYIESAKHHTEIYTTECRIVNVKPHKDGGIDGTYTEMQTVTVVKPTKFTEETTIEAIEEVMGNIEKDIFDKYIIKGVQKKYPLFKAVLEMYKDVEYIADVSNVDTKRIETKQYAPSRYSGYYNGYQGSYGETYHKLKSKSKSGITDDIIDNCPFSLTEIENEYLRKQIGKVSFAELKKLYIITAEVNDEVLESFIEEKDTASEYLNGYDLAMSDFM